MNYIYYNGAERYQFYRIPKLLFTHSNFQSISCEAKILYGLMLERAGLSVQNGWLDEDGKVYIFFSAEEVSSSVNCAVKKAFKILSELDSVGLIRRKIRGQGKPAKIYVMEPTPDDYREPSQTSHKDQPRLPKMTTQEQSFGPTCPGQKGKKNNPDINNPELSETESNPSPLAAPAHRPSQMRCDGMEEKEWLENREQIKANIDYRYLVTQFPDDLELTTEIVDLMADTVSSKADTIRLGGINRSADLVRDRLLALTSDHIRYVIGCMKGTTTEIRNIRQYLLTALYNSPTTINSYYHSKVNHDMAQPQVAPRNPWLPKGCGYTYNETSI